MAEVELQQIGTYPVTELLHVGSTSTLYRSSKPRKKDLLIRRFHTPLTTDEAKTAFLERYKKLKKFIHTHVVSTKDAGFVGDIAYLVMEKADGELLRQRMTPDAPPHPDEIKPYFSKIAAALRDADNKGVLHGNLHPGALWITTPPTFVGVGDFALFMPELDDLSAAIPYMAPEALKEHPIAASDQYALAAIVYEWLGGRRPYTATERDALLAQQEKEQLPSLHELNSHVSSDVEEVIARALSYNPADRFPHTLDFFDHYLSALVGFSIKPTLPVQQQPVTPYPTTRKAKNTAVSEITTGSSDSQRAGTLVPGSFLQDGRYIVDNVLGEGSIGAVVSARDTRINKLVVIKELISNKQEDIRNFEREVKTLADLKHDLIPDVTDHFQEGPSYFMVQKYIAGETLEKYIQSTNQPMAEQEALIYTLSILDILSYLERQMPPIIHRDIKPANIIIDRGKRKRAWLVDFGIARAKTDKKQTSALGTPGYAPPEQYQGNADLRSDLYALAATLHYVLTNRNPHDNPPFDFPPVRLFNPRLTVDIERVLGHALKPNINERYQNVAAMKRDIDEILAHRFNISFDMSNYTIRSLGLPPTSSASTPLVPQTPHIPVEPAPLSDSQLHHTIVADLRQGGILSKSLSGYEERQAQVEMAAMVARALSEHVPAVIEAGTGTGKALDVETPIPTPTGWKRMGDLVVGDMVFDEKGNPTRVVAAFEVMYDRPCYEVEFSDGSMLVADAEHEWVSYTAADRKRTNQLLSSAYTAKNFVTLDKLALLDQLITQSCDDDLLSVDEAVTLIGGHHWSVYQAARKMEAIRKGRQAARYPRSALLTTVRDRLKRDLKGQRRDGRAYTLVTTQQMSATLTIGASGRANHAIEVTRALTLPEVTLPIAPYFLGVWLGDGGCRNNQITTADPDLIPEIEKDGYTVRSLKSHPYLYAVDDENGKAPHRWQPGMAGRLRALGLLQNKHIPTIYLRASEQQRRALLAGLLDTDGTVNRDGAVEFTTTSPQLAQDVYELICSLGFRSTSRQGRARFNGKDCGPKWTLAFTTNEQVFRLERKIAAHKERLRSYSPERNRFRYVVAVRKVPSHPVRCIQVDSPSHLYLAGRSMIPTHNSLAYLLPIIRSGKVALISTANKALQEQLFYKDIPFIQKHIKRFDAALVKGMSNYVCLDRVESERTGMQAYTKHRDFQRLLDVLHDPDARFSGDLESLSFQLSADIRGRVAADGDQCAWSKCDFYERCYVRHMRVRAQDAQAIVINHTLLLLDAAMGGFLLPERDVIVLDEAHHLEEEATRVFTYTITAARIQTLLAQRMLKDHSLMRLQEEAFQASSQLWARVERIAEFGMKGRINLQEPLEEGLILSSKIDDLTDSLRKQCPKNLPEKEEQLYDKLVKRAQNLAEDLRIVFSVDHPEKLVYYIERVDGPGSRSGSPFEVSAAPLDVTDWLKAKLFSRYPVVICTSATLATVGTGGGAGKSAERKANFAYFRRRVGLEPEERHDVLESILPLAFDYANHALLYLPRHLPQPTFGSGSDEYMKAVAREMYRLVKISHGRAFLLFSSKRMLDRAYELMAPHLEFPLLKQGDMTRLELTRRFRREEGAVLFGLKSFWEGVDIAGDALSLVVIDKLPFDPPDDPVHEARVAQMKAAGENWFGTYVLPQAVLRLKQGLGRLLRTRDDRGVMALLDTRLHTKGYGKLVLEALPPARRTFNIRDVEQFFAQA